MVEFKNEIFPIEITRLDNGYLITWKDKNLSSKVRRHFETSWEKTIEYIDWIYKQAASEDKLRSEVEEDRRRSRLCSED